MNIKRKNTVWGRLSFSLTFNITLKFVTYRNVNCISFELWTIKLWQKKFRPGGLPFVKLILASQFSDFELKGGQFSNFDLKTGQFIFFGLKETSNAKLIAKPKEPLPKGHFPEFRIFVNFLHNWYY